jgi:hypothetical protein
MLQCKRCRCSFTAPRRFKPVQASSRQGFISRRDFKDEPRHHSASRRSSLFDDAKAENADEDQVQRDDVVQQPRHDENENAGNERDDGLKLADIDGHVFFSIP